MPHEDRPIAKPQIVVRYFSQAAKRRKVLLAFTVLGPVVLQFAMLAYPWYLREFLDYLVEPAGSVAPEVFERTILIIGALLLLGWAMRRVRGRTSTYFQAAVMQDLTADSFQGLLSHSHQFFVTRFSGTLTRRITKYRDAFETLHDVLTMTLLPLFVFIGGATIILCARNLVLGTAFAAWCLAVLIMQYELARWRQPLREIRTAEDSAVTGAIADAITNHSAISLFSGLPFELSRMRERLTSWRDALIRSWMADENIWAVQGLLMIALNIAMLWGAYIFWRRGSLTVGDFVLIQTYISGTFDQIFNINRDLRRVFDSFADAGEMVAILERPVDVPDPAKPAQVDRVRGGVTFEDVGFKYGTQSPVLDAFTLSVAPGERVALVGPSGAGKSTITRVLLRQADVSHGAVRIDGIDVRDIARDTLHDLIAFVPQDPVLFHRSLLENIRYGRRDASDAEVLDAAHEAHCHEFIARLPFAYDTYVGERGITLSGGERQRVAIARAILKDAPILILDEATSSLDSESEALIQEALDTLMEGKTVIAIAHRLSTIMHMDRIIVIEAGRIVDQGTHTELLSRPGLYQKLWNIQAGGFLGEADDNT